MFGFFFVKSAISEVWLTFAPKFADVGRDAGAVVAHNEEEFLINSSRPLQLCVSTPEVHAGHAVQYTAA